MNQNIYISIFLHLFDDFMTTSYKENTDKEVHSTPPEQEYIVEPLKDDFVCIKSASSSISVEEDVELLEFTKASENSFEISLTGTSIVQGQTRYNKAYVGSNALYLDISLSWGSTKNILSLTIYSPTGVSYGSYKPQVGSSSLVLRIRPKTGTYLQGGYWKLNVYGASISGTEYYTLRAAYHT
jgi:hypothetical protein